MNAATLLTALIIGLIAEKYLHVTSLLRDSTSARSFAGTLCWQVLFTAHTPAAAFFTAAASVCAANINRIAALVRVARIAAEQQLPAADQQRGAQMA